MVVPPGPRATLLRRPGPQRSRAAGAGHRRASPAL